MLTAERVWLPKYHSAQAQIWAERKRWNVLQCGRRFGKTTFGERLVAEVALAGHRAAWLAPTYKLLDEPWRDLCRILKPVTRSVDKQQRRLELTTEGIIDFWSMDNPDPGRGRKYKRLVVDEAGIVRDLEEVWTKALRATLTDYRGDAWFLGTPKGRNFFHTLFLKGQEGEKSWASWRFATVINPYLDAAEIDEARAGMPELAFRQEYLGEAVEDGSNPFGESFIRACLAPLSTKPPKYWGWDLAKSLDWTVGIALDEDGVVCRFERWQGPWTVTVDRIIHHCKGQPAYVDSTGVGDPVLEQLQRTVGHQFEGYKFSLHTRQQLLEGLRMAIQRGQVGFPEGTALHPRVLLNELDSFQYVSLPSGVKYRAPDGLHDDCVMALALAVEKKAQYRPIFVGSLRVGPPTQRGPR